MKKTFTKAATLCLAVILLCGMVSGCAAKIKKVALADYPTTVVASYGDEKIYLSEVNYAAKIQQWYTEMYYSQILGNNIWSQEITNGKTMADMTKEDVMAAALQTRVLMEHAEEYGVTLMDEDMAKINKAAADTLDGIPEEVKEAAAVDGAMLTDIYTKNAIANKVWAAMVADVDTEVDPEEIRQTTVSYVLFSDKKEEVDGEAEAKALVEAVTADKTLKEAAEEKELYANTTSYTKNAEQETELGKAAAALATGETTTCYVEGTGWYAIQCENDFDEEKTEAQKDRVIAKRQAEIFEDVYAGWEKKEFVVDEAVWANVNMDKPIYVAPTAAEPKATESEAAEAETTEAATTEAAAESSTEAE